MQSSFYGLHFFLFFCDKDIFYSPIDKVFSVKIVSIGSEIFVKIALHADDFYDFTYHHSLITYVGLHYRASFLLLSPVRNYSRASTMSRGRKALTS